MSYVQAVFPESRMNHCDITIWFEFLDFTGKIGLHLRHFVYRLTVVFYLIGI